MRYAIREMRPPDFPLLEDFLYEAIFLPEGTAPPPRSILDEEALRVYIRDFGSRPGDVCLMAESGGHAAGLYRRLGFETFRGTEEEWIMVRRL